MATWRYLLCGLAAMLPATAAFAAPVNASAPAVATPAAPLGIAHRNGGIEVRQGPMLLRVDALTDSILRVRVAPSGALPEDSSWAVPAAFRRLRAGVQPTASGFTTTQLQVSVSADLGVTISDPQGRAILADDAEPLRLHGRGFTVRKLLPQGEHIYGLGDKTGGSLDRRGESFVDWNTDAYAFSSSTDPIYKSIPFYIGVGSAGGTYGLLFDNSWRTGFDFGHHEPDVTALSAPAGPIDYYVIAGPSTAEVVRRYTELTGKAPLAPLWSLGYQQSRYSYMSADEVRSIISRLRSDQMPTDVVWLDIDFQDRNRPFTVNKQTFPDLGGLVREARNQGVRLVTIADLHVARAPGENYAPYDSGRAGNHFVHNPDGSDFVGEVWPGPSVFPDFTAADTRRWWGGLFKPFVDDGIAGFWNDMNEPSVFKTPTATMPLNVLHRVTGDNFASRTATHAEVHNVYGMENTRATYEGLRRLRPDERAFVMTRASYAGGQRYAVTWTGDNSATWDHLKLSVHQLINLGLSGFSYSAADVGGFTGGPSADLLTRWFEIAAFTPIFRDHAAKDTPRAEPWVDGPEHLAIRRRFVEQRYRLLPYLYALADQSARFGDPIMRPLFYDYPESLAASCDQSMTFTLGKALLVAPPPKPESPQRYDVCLPAGGWFDFWTGLPTPGAGAISETPQLDRLPVYVRAGSILPSQPLVNSTTVTPRGPLTLDIYPGPDCEGMVYADDGHSMAYARGIFLRQRITCRALSSGHLVIEFAPSEGRYQPWWKSLALRVHGQTGPSDVRGGRAAVAASFDSQARTTMFSISPLPRGGSVELQCRSQSCS